MCVINEIDVIHHNQRALRGICECADPEIDRAPAARLLRCKSTRPRGCDKAAGGISKRIETVRAREGVRPRERRIHGLRAIDGPGGKWDGAAAGESDEGVNGCVAHIESGIFAHQEYRVAGRCVQKCKILGLLARGEVRIVIVTSVEYLRVACQRNRNAGIDYGDRIGSTEIGIQSGTRGYGGGVGAGYYQNVGPSPSCPGWRNTEYRTS